MDNNKEVQLESFAARLNYPFISSLDQVPSGQQWLFESAIQKMLDNTTDNCVIVSKSGVASGSVFASTTSIQNITRAVDGLNNTMNVHRNNVRIYLCTSPVINQIYDKKRFKKEPQAKGAIATGRSAAQTLMETIVGEAMTMSKVSDIHLKVNNISGDTEVKFRTGGILRLHPDAANNTKYWESSEVTAACSAIINTDASNEQSTKKAFSVTKAIDASFTLSGDYGVVKIRYAQVPSSIGFTATLRIHKEGAEDTYAMDLKSMGYLSEQREIIESAAQSPSGIIVVSGPTGSGKTTMLNTVLRKIPHSKSIYTFEDPIEMVIPGATQVPVDDDIEDGSLSWVSLSKNVLRLDPDVIMFGEIRASDVAHEAMNMAMTGHLVFTTLHSNSSLTCIPRLNDLGMPFTKLSDPSLLKALVFQRLVPKICSHCSISLFEDVDETNDTNARHIMLLRDLFSGCNNVKIANISEDNHCENCGGLGFSGRVLVAEVAEINKSVRSYIAGNDLAGWERHLLNEQWVSINVHTSIHVIKGDVCAVSLRSFLSYEVTKEDVAIAKNKLRLIHSSAEVAAWIR